MSNEREFLDKLRRGVFHVGEDGEVWRLRAVGRTGPTRPIPPRRAEVSEVSGYLRIVLGKSRNIKAHRAVYVALRGPIPPDKEINHKNGVKTDNFLENLELVSRSGNIRHSYDHSLRLRPTGENNAFHKLTADEARAIRALRGQASSAKVAARFNVGKSTVKDIWSGKSWA